MTVHKTQTDCTHSWAQRVQALVRRRIDAEGASNCSFLNYLVPLRHPVFSKPLCAANRVFSILCPTASTRAHSQQTHSRPQHTHSNTRNAIQRVSSPCRDHPSCVQASCRSVAVSKPNCVVHAELEIETDEHFNPCLA